ncbi:MAG: hypothetical protein FWF95_06800, partial [Syntrophorhabdaceae bacterium]|nr:hypothetical protein [Syntrophorhabdaceae bacterium]
MKGKALNWDVMLQELKDEGYVSQNAETLDDLIEAIQSDQEAKRSGTPRLTPGGITDYEIAKMAAKWGYFQSASDLEEVKNSMQAVRAQHEGTDTWMKAPNGQPTNLSEHQWLAVRTPQFKQWFGDWEVEANAKWLLNSKEVASITGDEFKKSSTEDLLTQVDKFFKSIGGKVDRAGIGSVILDRRGAKNSIGHKLGRAKAAAFAAVPEIIKQGRIIEYQENWKGRGYSTYVIAAPITIGAEKYIGEVVLNRKTKGTNFYLHEVEIQEKLQAGASVQAGIKSGTPQGASRLIISKKLADVKGRISEVVDKNGEPLMVYRGDLSGKEQFSAAQGNWFAEVERVAQDYSSGEVYPVYLKIEKPFVFSEESFAELKKTLSDKFADWLDMDDSELTKEADFIELRDKYIAFRNNRGSTVRDFYNEFLPKVSKSMSHEKLRDVMAKSLHDVYAFEFRQVDYRDTNILNPYLQMMGYDGVIGDYDPLGEATGREFITFKPTQVKSINNRGTFDPSDPRILYQSAFHGSPYRFDKFTLDHIGKGEGNQTYGWGLYFAGNKEVAEHYRNKLSYGDVLVDGKKPEVKLSTDWGGAHQWTEREVLDILSDEAERVDYDINALRRNLRTDASNEPIYKDALNAIKNAQKIEKNSGQLYEADIPEDHELLDWDKTISNHPENVKNALLKLKTELPEKAKNFIASWDKTGEEFYRELSYALGQKGASLLFNKIGIKGIRYLDNASRDKGEGSHNYVIFDDAAIDILKTYYQSAQQNEKRQKFDAMKALEVSSEEVKSLRGPDAGFTKRLIEWAKSKDVFGKYTNLDSGMDNIEFNAASVRNVKQHYGWSGKLALLEVAPELIKTGVYLESTERNDQGLISHVFVGKAKIDGPEKAVGFVVREDVNGRRYFDHRIVDIENTKGEAVASPSYRPAREIPDNRVTGDKSIANIVRKHLGVNPDVTLNQGPLGSTKIYPEGYLISLFKGANLSTLLHETGHIFFEEMERVVQSGAADQVMAQDYEKLRNWLGAQPGDTLTVKQKEQFARGFEAYLMEGKAPTEDLQGAFDRFRQWLLKVYQEAKNLNVELTDEVRGVFDRLLATEQEIAEARESNTSQTLHDTYTSRRDTGYGVPIDPNKPVLPEGALSHKDVTPISGVISALEKAFDVPIRIGKFREKAHGIYKSAHPVMSEPLNVLTITLKSLKRPLPSPFQRCHQVKLDTMRSRVTG